MHSDTLIVRLSDSQNARKYIFLNFLKIKSNLDSKTSAAMLAREALAAILAPLSFPLFGPRKTADHLELYSIVVIPDASSLCCIMPIKHCPSELGPLYSTQGTIKHFVASF